MARNIKRNTLANEREQNNERREWSSTKAEAPSWTKAFDRDKWTSQGAWKKNPQGHDASAAARASQAVDEMQGSGLRDRVLHWTEDTAMGTRLPERGDLGKALLFGLAGGAAATIVMTQYQNALSKLQRSDQQEQKSERQKQQEVSDQSTVKVADRVARATTSHEVPQEHKQTAGNTVHYAFGTLMGGVYGALTSFFDEAPFGTGVLFGIGLWLAADEVILPQLGISKPPSERSLKEHAQEASMHAVYGVCLDAVNLLRRKVA